MDIGLNVQKILTIYQIRFMLISEISYMKFLKKYLHEIEIKIELVTKV